MRSRAPVSAAWLAGAFLALGVSVGGAQAPAAAARNRPRAAAASKPAAASAAGAAGAAAGESGPTLGLQFGAARGLRPAAAEASVLPNGLRLLVAENRELPQVNFFLLIGAGTNADPEGKTGLAELTARAARRGGTSSLSAMAVEELAGRLGGAIDMTVYDTRVQFMGRVPSARAAEFAALLRDLATAPLLDTDAVDLAHGQMLDEVILRATTVGSILEGNFRRRLYADAPLGRTPNYESLENLTRADVEAFHRSRYVPGQALLAVEGDLSAADAKELAAKLFGTWKGAAAPAADAPVASPKALPGVLFADRPEWRLSGLVMGQRSGLVGDADAAAMYVIADILAAGADSRLARRVKEAGGWRAEWGAGWEAGYQRPGEFAVRATVEGPYTTQAIQIVRGEIERLRSGQVTDQEVEQSRVRTLTRVALRAQSSADQLLERALAEFHGQPGDLLTKTYQNLLALTRADVARAAARNLQPPDQLVVVVAGSSTLFDKPLSTVAAKVDPIDLSVPVARPMKPRTDPASLEKGREALARWQQAMGGREKLAAIKQLRVQSEGTTFLNNAMTPIKLIDRWLDGDIYRQDQEFNFSSRSVFYNGKIGWIGLPGVVGALNEGLLYQIRGELFRLPFRVALSDSMAGRQVAHLGGNAIQITEGESYGMRVHFDPATGLPQRVAYRIPMSGGGSIAVEEVYAEWKEFNGAGIKWPSRVTVKRNGRRTDELTVTDVRFSGLSLADMEKKP